MDRPSDRCEYDHDVPDYFKPYCCFREAKGNGACAWHVPAKGKSADFLEAARVHLSWGYPKEVRDRWIGLRGERLDGAYLEGADLRTLSFEGCTLAGANLRDANLHGGDLSNANVREATLAEASAPQCRLDDAVLEKADLSEANLEGATLANANLKNADLSGANLQDADLTGADLRRATLVGANLQGADLPGSRLFKADLSEADLGDADLTGAVLREATLTDAYLLSATLDATSLESADLTDADTRRATFVDAVLAGCDFERAALDECEFTDANARGAVFDDASLERARLDHAKLYGASLTGARIYGASFTGAAISGETEFGGRVRYDPNFENGDVEDSDPDDGSDPVDRLTKATGSYGTLEALAADNGFPGLARQYALRRASVRRQQHRDRGRWGAWLGATLSWAFTGYGERPWRVLATAFLVVVGCGALYPLGWIRGREGGELVWYSSGVDGILGPLADGLAFSVGTFTTGSVSQTPVGAGRALAAVESVAGLAVLAALVFVLARRATR